jgi:hypothetical protein
MTTERRALQQFLRCAAVHRRHRLRVISVGALVALALIAGALTLPSAARLGPGAAAVSDPDAASGGPQAPGDALRGKALAARPP